MPKKLITPAIAKVIDEGSKAGKSANSIADEVEQSFGIRLNQTTIKRRLDQVAGRPRVRKPKDVGWINPNPKGVRSTPRLVPVIERLGIVGAEPTLVAKEALEAQAIRVQEFLASDAITVGERVGLLGELRQIFTALRKGEEAARQVNKTENSDAAWVLQKAKHLARVKSEFGGAIEIVDGGSETPDVPTPARSADHG